MTKPKKPKQVTEEDLDNQAKSFQFFLTNSTRKIVWILVIFGVLWITASYVLAFMDKGQIAESLSSNVCSIVIGTVITAVVSHTIENVFRYNPKFGGKSQFPDDIKARLETKLANHEVEQQIAEDTYSDSTVGTMLFDDDDDNSFPGD